VLNKVCHGAESLFSSLYAAGADVMLDLLVQNFDYDKCLTRAGAVLNEIKVLDDTLDRVLAAKQFGFWIAEDMVLTQRICVPTRRQFGDMEEHFG